MEESQKFFEPMPVEREETLVTASPDASLSTPRFDEVEAQVARPVVPLANNPLRRGVVGVRRRQWPIALVLISALAGGVVSLLAFRLYQQRQQQSQVAATQIDTQMPETNAATEPTPLAETNEAQTAQQAQTESPIVFEEFDPAKEGVAANGGDTNAARKTAETDAKPAAPAGKEERKEDAKPPAATRAAEPRPRIVETITAPRPVEARGENVSRSERRDDEDFFEERRERRRERRERRRGRGRNIDRIKDIFEGPPPA
jgi:hypothetical protein